MNVYFYTGVFLGVGIGLNAGLWLGTYLHKKWYKPVIEGYKADTKKWFEEYLKMLGWYQEMKTMYFKEAIKNIGK